MNTKIKSFLSLVILLSTNIAHASFIETKATTLEPDFKLDEVVPVDIDGIAEFIYNTESKRDELSIPTKESILWTDSSEVAYKKFSISKFFSDKIKVTDFDCETQIE